MLALLLACAGADDTGATDSTDTTPDTAATPDGLAEVEVVHLATADGLTLEADWYAGSASGQGVLLLHMSPLNGYDRTVWPVAWIGDLRLDGFAVLALDRRGAGGSEGDPADAAAEPGVYDARAGVDFLLDAGLGEVAIVGGSSGTTTTLDYAATAGDAGYPAPFSVVLMSPGTYTEAQHDVEELPVDRVMVTYPESEATWNENHAPDAPASWRWQEYPGDAHAANVLPEQPEVGEDVRSWLLGGLEGGVYPVE